MSRRSSVAVLVLLAMSGCASSDLAASPEARCRQLAYRNPAVQEQVERGTSTPPQVKIPALLEQDDLVRHATQSCLAAQGLAPRGGVQSVKQY